MDGVLAGWDGPVPTVICEACDSMRTSWLTRLLSEEHEGFTRRQLLGLLNRHKSYTACRQIIRIMQTEPRAISDEEAVVILSRENAAKNGAETPATPATPQKATVAGPANVLPSKEPAGEHDTGAGAIAHRRETSVISTPSARSSSCSPASSAPSSPGKQPTNPVRSGGGIDAQSLASKAALSPLSSPGKVPMRIEEKLDEADLEAAFALRRALKQEQRKEEARLKREEARRDMAARRRAECKARATMPIPPEFVVMGRAYEPMAECKEFEERHVTWDETESIVCGKCGKASRCLRGNVVPLIIGDKDHLYRAVPLVKYGAVVAVPALHCQSRPGCCIGYTKTMIALYWDGKWWAMEDFLTVVGARDSLREVPRELCKERVILHVLHWFSKTREAREDDHAGLPPCGVDREAAIVYRGDRAAGYCTFSSELAETDEGWRLPTFYNIFVRLAHRKSGCARQMVSFFFRPQSVGKGRWRCALQPTTDTTARQPPRHGHGAAEHGLSAAGLEAMKKVEVEVPAGIDEELDFLDMLQIDPPVSAALTTCIEKILSVTERNNIVCDVGKVEGGSLVFVIDPCDPKTRVFKPQGAFADFAEIETTKAPHAFKYTPMPREKGQEVIIGGICRAADVPTPAILRKVPLLAPPPLASAGAPEG